MTKFYTEGAGHIKEEWGFPDTSSNYLKIVMAAKYETGYYRVVLSGVVSHDTVNVFYIDFGNYATVNVADVTSATSDTSTKTSWLSPPRWSLPGSGVSARSPSGIWGSSFSGSGDLRLYVRLQLAVRPQRGVELHRGVAWRRRSLRPMKSMEQTVGGTIVCIGCSLPSTSTRRIMSDPRDLSCRPKCQVQVQRLR